MEILGHGLKPVPYLLMPYFPLGNLNNQHTERPFSRRETQDILCQILQALAYLHPRQVAHRDLKPDNILVESRHIGTSITIRLADFGLAKVAKGTKLDTKCGTVDYMAPEISITSVHQPSVDLWSAGVIILQYACGLPEVPDNMPAYFRLCKRYG